MSENTKPEFSFRRFLILLVAVLGGLYFLFTFLPSVTGFVVLFGGCVFIFYVGIGALRKGCISINARTRFVNYTRTDNPVAFWFYVLFFMFIGLMGCCVVLILLLQKLNIIPHILK